MAVIFTLERRLFLFRETLYKRVSLTSTVLWWKCLSFFLRNKNLYSAQDFLKIFKSSCITNHMPLSIKHNDSKIWLINITLLNNIFHSSLNSLHLNRKWNSSSTPFSRQPATQPDPSSASEVIVMLDRTGLKLNKSRHDKTNKISVRPATQICLGIRPVWSVLAVRSVGS